MKNLSWLLLSLFAVVALVAAACGDDDDDAAPDTAGPGNGAVEDAGYAHPELLETTETLQAKLGQEGVVVVDLRNREAYEDGHIPGAVWYDRTALKDDEDDTYVIKEADFAEKVGALGIDNDTWVVAYDDGNGLWATRFWWVLSYYGHKDASVLNGGFAKWQADGGEVTKQIVEPSPATFVTRPDEKEICALDYVLEQVASERDDVVILDVRSAAEYTGADVRAKKGGHIPGAVNLDWVNSLTGDPPVWKDAATLRKQFRDVGIDEDTEVITYCQTAVRAAHTFFTLRLVGLGQARNYDGSWYEWGNNPDTPIEQ
ncbi:MAG: sulfurtransferase [Dehalococcoidia bacterium]